MYKGILFFIIACLGFTDAISDPGTGYNLSEEKGLYAKIADVPLNTGSGNIRLPELYQQTPVMLAFIFTRCTGICNPFLLQLKDNLESLQSKEKFKVVVVSFDPTDSLSDLNKIAFRFGLQNNDQWIFATTPQISKLINSAGFYPVWDSSRQQFDHDALLVGIDKEGLITKKLIGLRDAKSLQWMIRSIGDEFMLSYPLPRENMLFSCFSYDPITGKKSPSYGLLFLILPAILTILLLVWLAYQSPKWRLKAEKEFSAPHS